MENCVTIDTFDKDATYGNGVVTVTKSEYCKYCQLDGKVSSLAWWMRK